MLHRTIVAIALISASVRLAHADTRATVRLGMLPLELEASAETPLFGSSVDRMIDRYNDAAAAYDRVSGATTARIDTGDVGVSETLVIVAPGLELGAGGTYYFRVELPLGYADNLTSVGIGLYPINLQVSVRKNAALYLSLGGSASWLDRPGEGDLGALVTARAAGGLRVARHVMFEVGYNAYVLGGSYNDERLDAMMDTMQLGEPRQVVSAGEARGIVDASLGVAF
ncbi:MAG: hypothetical protein JNL83_12935 [Myxococcales bacterium]|nr:hypothetical protein [Myxococcales bacterium]